MDHDWEDEDQDGYAGPDAYIDEPEFDVEDQVMQDDPEIIGEASDGDAATEDDDGINAQRQSMLEMLDCKHYSCTKPPLAPRHSCMVAAFISVIPASQPIQAGPHGVPTANLTSSFTMDQVRLLLAAAQSRGIRGSISVSPDDEDDDPDYVPDDDDEDDRLEYYLPWGRRRSQPKKWFKPVTEPQKAGVELMTGGEFGRLRAKKVTNVRKMLKMRELGRKTRGGGVEKEDFARVSKIFCMQQAVIYLDYHSCPESNPQF